MNVKLELIYIMYEYMNKELIFVTTSGKKYIVLKINTVLNHSSYKVNNNKKKLILQPILFCKFLCDIQV